MTSITYFRTPHVAKLDRRYRMYKEGFTYSVQFDIRATNEGWHLYAAAVKQLEATYGLEYEWLSIGVFSRRVWNTNWRVDSNMTRTYSVRKIYLKSEQAVTMLLMAI